MPRVRFGVALLVPPPIDREVDGLRRAFGDPALARIPPHITLVPPVNVPVEEVPEVLAVLRAAAADARPLDLTLGPPRTFGTSEGVVYLEVGAPPRSRELLEGLPVALGIGPLDRPPDHPFVPHVTLATRVAADTVDGLLDAAAGFRDVAVTIDRLHLLQHETDPTSRWWPVADVPLRPAVVVGRGGLPVELTAGELVDPEARTVLADLRPSAADVPDGARPLVVAARRDRSVVGLAEGWTAGPVAELAAVCSTEDDGTDEHLRAAWWSAAAERGAS